MTTSLTAQAKLPISQAALVAIKPGSLALKSVPLPQINADEVLVKTAAVALNPSDHKLLDQSTTVGAISGSDYAGTVVQVGADAQNTFQVGDRVFGVVFGANPGCPTNGAFAQYVAAPADLCLRVPDAMLFLEACSLGMAIMTVGLAVRSLKLRSEFDVGKEQIERNWIMVNGGATATGTIALQIFKLLGYSTIATCSPQNFELVKSRGADHAVDYHLPTCRQDIRHLTDNTLHLVLDCIGDASSMTLCYGAIGIGGGRYTALEAYPRKLTIRRRDVEHDWILGWTLFGNEVQLAGAYHRPARPADREFGTRWIRSVNKIVATGAIQTHPLQSHLGGLAALLPRLSQMRDGKVSAKKLVFPIA